MIPSERSEILFRVRFEDNEPTVHVVAHSAGDEARLWEWLRHSGVLMRLAALALEEFERLLDEGDG